eukprot:gene2452-1456_t
MASVSDDEADGVTLRDFLAGEPRLWRTGDGQQTSAAKDASGTGDSSSVDEALEQSSFLQGALY